MVDTLASSDQDIDAGVTTLSNRARFWLLIVAALDVLLVISSMVALNAALPDIALQTAAMQTQLPWIVDGYTMVPACQLCYLHPTGPRRSAARVRAAASPRSRRSDDELGSPMADHHNGGVRPPAGDGGKHRTVDHP